MSLRRIATTSLASLRPVGRAADRDYHSLTGYLAGATSFGPQFAALFSEPVYVKGGDSVDWYWEVGTAPPVPVNNLPETDRERVLELVAAKLRALREEGERLRARGHGLSLTLLAAASVPDPLSDYVRWAPHSGSAQGGAPVIIGWGFVREDSTLPKGTIEGTRGRLVQPDASSHSLDLPAPPAAKIPAAQTPTAKAPSGSAAHPGLTTIDPEIGRQAQSASVLLVHGSLHWLNWLLWSFFALLLVLIAALLLRSCGLGLPFSGVLVSYCHAASGMLIDSDRTQTLRSAIADLELRLARREAQCLAQLPPSSGSTALRSAPSQQEIERRRDREGAETGEIQLSLAWDGPADLDLSVVCPNGGIIYFKTKQNCGGTLDVDMNSTERQSQTPVEHIVWPAGTAPVGTYEVRVSLYNSKGDDRPAIPFVVELKLGASTKRFEGQAGPPTGTSHRITTFTR